MDFRGSAFEATTHGWDYSTTVRKGEMDGDEGEGLTSATD